MIDGNSIYIQGVIGEEYTYNDFLNDIKAYNINKRKNINIVIDSIGGYVDEADKIYSKLISLKDKYTINVKNGGDVMSCATIIFSAGDNRTFDFAKGNMIIHNPWVEVQGDAKELRKLSNDLQKTEDRYTLLYSKLSKINPAEISKIMDEDRFLTPEEVLKLKLATEIKNAEVAPNEVMTDKKAYAFAALCAPERNINKKIDIKMKIVDFVKTLMKVSEVKNLVVTSLDGVDYNVTNEDGSEDLKVGSAIDVDGQPYEGQIILADDTVITVENGIVTKIEQPEQEVAPEVTEEAPKGEESEQKPEETPAEETPAEPETEEPKENTDAIDSLRGKVDELFALLNDLTERVNALEGKNTEEVESLKNQIRNMASSNKPNTVNDTPDEGKCMFGFKK